MSLPANKIESSIQPELHGNPSSMMMKIKNIEAVKLPLPHSNITERRDAMSLTFWPPQRWGLKGHREILIEDRTLFPWRKSIALLFSDALLIFRMQVAKGDDC